MDRKAEICEFLELDLKAGKVWRPDTEKNMDKTRKKEKDVFQNRKYMV